MWAPCGRYDSSVNLSPVIVSFGIVGVRVNGILITVVTRKFSVPERMADDFEVTGTLPDVQNRWAHVGQVPKEVWRRFWRSSCPSADLAHGATNFGLS